MSIPYTPWPAEMEERIKVNYIQVDHDIDTHRHDFIEIAFVAQGSCLHRYHDQENTLLPGDIFVISPHEVHAYTVQTDPVGIYNCLFYPEVLGEDWKRIREIRGIYDFLMVEPFYRTESRCREILHLKPAEASYVESVLKSMMEESQTQNSGYFLVLKASLLLLLPFLGRVWDRQLKLEAGTYSGKRELLSQALTYIEQNLTGDISICDLAASVYLSPHYFRRVFKETTGLAPLEYINQVRIARASLLLKEQNCTISRAAECVGITDVNYFSRLFRSITGESPSDYRKRNNPY